MRDAFRPGRCDLFDWLNILGKFHEVDFLPAKARVIETVHQGLLSSRENFREQGVHQPGLKVSTHVWNYASTIKLLVARLMMPEV